MILLAEDKLTWILIVLPYIAAPTCYRQNGTQFGSGNDYICNSSAEFNPDAPGGSHKVIACSETTYCCARLSVDTSRDPYYCCPGNSSATSELLTLGPANYLAGIRLYTTWPPNPSATSTQSAIQTASNSASLATPMGDGEDTSPSEGDGLSTGATAGIAVGATVAVLAALIVGFFLWMRHKQRGNKATSQESENETQQMVQNEASVSSRDKQQGAWDKSHRGEMYSEGRAAELPIEDRSYELYAEDRRFELPEGGRL
ncbi:unnamed protein product [Cercospora beticola]|nr:unnamed protein product [Cercospora beticola]